MAFQILPGDNRAAAFGESLATGLGGILGQLAQRKAQQMQLGQFMQAGLTPQDAQLITLFSGAPEIQAKLLGSLWERGGNEGISALNLQSAAQELPNALAQQGVAGTTGLSALSQMQPNVSATGLQALTPEATSPALEAEQQLLSQATSPAKSGFYRMPRREAREEEKLDIEKQKVSSREKAEAFKFSKDLINQTVEKAKAARNDLRELNELQELNESGKLDTPGYVEFLKRSGFEIPALMNPESEQFQKIQQTFLRDAKTIFGARVSNFEIEQFLKAIPSLSQSAEGRKRVIADMKYVAQAGLAYEDALRDVIKENKGIPPYDLALQIEEKIGPKLDKLHERFKKDLAKPVPPSQSKYITALQAAAGEAVGRIPGAIKGAAKGALGGALAGRYLGGPGALGGAAAGGLAGLLGLI